MNHPARPCFGRPHLILVALILGGCRRPEGDALVIATPWPSGERAAIQSDYRKAHPSAPPIAWVALLPGDDTMRIVPGVDLVLGLPSADLDALASADALAPVAEGDTRPWRVARRLTLGLEVNTSLGIPVAGPSLADRALASRVALDDPRRDPLTLAWAKARLASAGWPKGYAELVRTSANARRTGRADSGPERVRRGEEAVAIDADVVGPLDERTALVRLAGAPPWLEGVALVRGARSDIESRAFLAFLAERGQSEPVPDDFPAADPVADGLLADLLGAALVDAQDELWAAADALDRAGHPEPFEGYLDMAPPWPPTSIEKLRGRPESDDLLVALAAEITPDRDARAWLLQTWDRPSRPIDATWFRDAAGVRIAQEPRFRSWLRGEWTAWARQHFRRIAREATKGAPVGSAVRTPSGDVRGWKASAQRTLRSPDPLEHGGSPS